MNYLDYYILSGGWPMAIIVPCSIILLGSFFQAMIRIRSGRIVPRGLLQTALKVRGADDRTMFVEALGRKKSPLAVALGLIFKEVDPATPTRPPRRDLAPVVDDAVAHVTDDLYEEIGVFSTLFTMGPLLGLFGTIMGMMRAFNVFGAESEKNLSTLSEGIRQALVTTLWGLGIAIGAFMAAQIFQARIRRYERIEIPENVEEVLTALYGAEAAPGEEEAEDAGPRPVENDREGQAI